MCEDTKPRLKRLVTLKASGCLSYSMHQFGKTLAFATFALGLLEHPVSALPNLRMLSVIAQQFFILRPHFFCKVSNVVRQREMMEGLGVPLRVSEDIASLTAADKTLDDNIIVCRDDYTDKEITELLTKAPTLAAGRDALIWETKDRTRDDDYCEEHCWKKLVGVNQKIYSFNEDTLTLCEDYFINQHSVHTKIGMLRCKHK